MGHPWDEGQHGPDTHAVDEGTEPLLSVENMQVYFPVRRGILARVVDHVKAVDGISFDVYRGQTLGPGGRERLRQDHRRPGDPATDRTHGRPRDVRRHRHRLDRHRATLRNLRKNMQIIFQDPYGSLNPRMTIETTLTEPMLIHGIGKTRRPIAAIGRPRC